MVLSLRATAALLGLGSTAHPHPLPTYHNPDTDKTPNLNKPLPPTPGEAPPKASVFVKGITKPNKADKTNPYGGPFPSEMNPNAGLWATMRRDGDGVWQCHRCFEQNLLIHSRGSHPFGQLKCGKCNHVLCSDCTTSDVLRPIFTEITDPVFLAKLERTADGRICRKCGLVWKGTRKYCSCGGERWRGFLVGSSKDYREGNPDEVFARALEKMMGGIKDTPKEKKSQVRKG